MTGEMIEYKANGHTASGYLAMPASGSGPGLIVIQEWWGLVDHIIQLVDRFAANGFVALAPDLYHGEKAKSPDAAGKLMMALNIAQAEKEIAGAAGHLRSLDAVSPKKVGVIGFCMGGQLALYAAVESPDKVDAAVDFYGIHPNVPIDPSRLRVPVLAHFAKRDNSTPEAAARALEERFRLAGHPIEAHYYDADHAFFNDTRPAVYSPENAALAWERTLAFLRANL